MKFLTVQGAREIKARALKCVEQLALDLENEALVDSSNLLARGIAPGGRLYQIKMTLSFDEWEFINDTEGAVEL